METNQISAISMKHPDSEMTSTNRSNRNGSRDSLGLSFTIDYLLFDRGVKRSGEETAESCVTPQVKNDKLNRQSTKVKELGTSFDKHGNCLKESTAATERSNANKEEQHEKMEELAPTTTLTSNNVKISMDKPNQSYIALISKAILGSEEKKLLLCDIYQWIMDNYPYFKNKDKNWRNSVRHNLSLNDCFIKAGRSDNGKGHFWAIHPENYQDFSKGDYQCRRARRRIRKVVGQIHLSSLTSPCHATTPTINPHRPVCWCYPQNPVLPPPCLAPRFYWPWSNFQPQVGLNLGLSASFP